MPGTGDPVQRAMRERAAELRAESAARRAATTRRTFLAGTAALGAAAVAGPALGRSRRERRAERRQAARTGARVAVVGAGLAGLTCAYRLRQAGVRATVYEARRERIGGRCWTVRGFRHGQVAEHGGEFVDTRHVHLRRIVRELGLELEDRETAATPEDATRPLWLHGRLRDRDFLFRHGFDEVFARLEADFTRIGDYHYTAAGPAARAFDEMTVADWLRENVSDPLLRETIAIGQTGFFGLDPGRMSAINLLEAFVFPYEGADERYHVRGGNDRVWTAWRRRSTTTRCGSTTRCAPCGGAATARTRSS